MSVEIGEDAELADVAATVFDLIRCIRDPEKDGTLEDLNVVREDMVKVSHLKDNKYLVHIEFVPTVPHCSLATLIGLCMRVKLNRNLPYSFKTNINIAAGNHESEKDVNKQINDKERVAAALENPNLLKIVEDCIKEPQ